MQCIFISLAFQDRSYGFSEKVICSCRLQSDFLHDFQVTQQWQHVKLYFNLRIIKTCVILIG